jgi:hypothetical protein
MLIGSPVIALFMCEKTRVKIEKCGRDIQHHIYGGHRTRFIGWI